jgi:hypothetical protein
VCINNTYNGGNKYERYFEKNKYFCRRIGEIIEK